MRKVLLTFLLLAITLFPSAQPGILDTSFNATDKGYNNGDGVSGNNLQAMALQRDGRIVVAGDFSAYNGTPRNRLARLNADGSLDPYFATNGGPVGGHIQALAVRSDGKIVVGGNFSSFSGFYHNYLALLNSNGILDGSFNGGSTAYNYSGANNAVTCIAVQANDQMLIGGWFTAYNGTLRNRIARLHKDGSLDASFDPGSGANGTVYSIAVQPDGKLVIGGEFTSYNGVACNRIVRLNADGSLDATFTPGTGANGTVSTITLQSDGKLLIGGSFTSVDGTSRNYIARLKTDGSPDPTFNPGSGANSPITSIVIQADDKIVVGGHFTTFKGAARSRIARLSANGNLDASFTPGTGANNSVYALVLASDGKLVIGGNFSFYNNLARNRLARLNSDGSADHSFCAGSGANGSIYSVVQQADGRILIGGDFSRYNAMVRNRIARLNPDGTVDDTFSPGSGTDTAVQTIVLQPDGKILIGGSFTLYNGTNRNRIARLTANGSLDASFNPGNGTNSFISCMALQPDGRVLIGGQFTNYNGVVRNRIARLNPDGTVDGSFDPGGGPSGTVTSLVLQPDGKVLIGGAFTSVGGTTRNYIARLNKDGSLDASFNPAGGVNGTVSVLALQGDGKLLAGGAFTAFNGIARNHLVRLQADGSLDASFTPPSGMVTGVYAMVLLPDGKIMTAGKFQLTHTVTSYGMARLNADGSLDDSFSGGVTGTVYSMAVQGNDLIVIGGDFVSYYSAYMNSSLGRNRLARVHGGTNSITLGNIAPLSYCAGSTIAIPFTVSGVFSGSNGFDVLLSSASGSFERPEEFQYLGSLHSSASGTITAILPAGVPEGTRYKIQIVSSTPYVTSTDNGITLTIHALPDTPRITPAMPMSLCEGSSVVLTSSATSGNQWFKDNVLLPDATSQNYTTAVAGRYSVRTTQNGCPSAMSPLVSVSEAPAVARPVITLNGGTLVSSAATGNQWHRNGTPINGATTSYYVPLSSGLYSVEVTQGSCRAQSEAVNFVYTAITDPTGWDGAVTVYPVPVQDNLTITNSGGRKLQVQLLDMVGKQVRELSFTALSAVLPMQELAPGTYVLLLTDVKKKETLARTIVKQ